MFFVLISSLIRPMEFPHHAEDSAQMVPLVAVNMVPLIALNMVPGVALNMVPGLDALQER